MRSAYASWAKAFFVRARDERWGDDEIRSGLSTKTHRGNASKASATHLVAPGPKHENLDGIAANASPRDLADMICQLILKSREPRVVAELVTRQVKEQQSAPGNSARRAL